jgi:hypothetical protein
MPIVPFTQQSPSGRNTGPQPKPPDEPWVLMAAAQMHSEGKFTQKDEDASKSRR